MAAPAASLSTETHQSTPLAIIGHASGEGTPQLRPTMIDRCGPGVSVISPLIVDICTQLASSGSTDTSTGRCFPLR